MYLLHLFSTNIKIRPKEVRKCRGWLLRSWLCPFFLHQGTGGNSNQVTISSLTGYHSTPTLNVSTLFVKRTKRCNWWCTTSSCALASSIHYPQDHSSWHFCPEWTEAIFWFHLSSPHGVSGLPLSIRRSEHMVSKTASGSWYDSVKSKFSLLTTQDFCT